MTPIYYTRIVGGRFTSKPLRDLLLAYEGQDIEAFVRARQEYPSEGVHRHYHGRLIPLFTEYINQQGADFPAHEQSTHKALAKLLLTRTTYQAATDNYLRSIPSTRSLTREQMNDYTRRVERLLVQDLDLIIPDRAATFDLVT